MTFWLLDASVLLAREDADDQHHDAAKELLAGDSPLATLDLAQYEVANVAVRAWRDLEAAARLQDVVAAIAADGGLVRADDSLLAAAVRVAEAEGLTVYDAACVAGAAKAGAELVSCDLVNRGLAVTPEVACRRGA